MPTYIIQQEVEDSNVDLLKTILTNLTMSLNVINDICVY